MRASEYHSKLLKDGHLSIPSDIKSKIKPDTEFRVLIMPDEEADSWNRRTAWEFVKGYSDKDSIYDAL
ncbi:MAG: hypothetical protein HY786_06825 [Deltaproteobacteria bacterium]|nr:hypothetical protein [Deltaproteobacteria bacterium]